MQISPPPDTHIHKNRTCVILFKNGNARVLTYLISDKVKLHKKSFGSDAPIETNRNQSNSQKMLDADRSNIGPAVRVFANGPGDLGSIPGRVIPKTLKMELDTTLLNTQHYKVRFKGKVEQSREWSSAIPYTVV